MCIFSIKVLPKNNIIKRAHTLACVRNTDDKFSVTFINHDKKQYEQCFETYQDVVSSII